MVVFVMQSPPEEVRNSMPWFAFPRPAVPLTFVPM